MWLLSFVLLLSYLPPETGGELIRLYGRGFSFEVLEPRGWTLDTGSAPQVANFIIHPEGENWRRAPAVVYVRFVRRQAEDSLEDFVLENRNQFIQFCPFAEEEFSDLPLEPVEPFAIEVYDCPGVRREVVASAALPGYFAVFVLSEQQKGAIEESADVFRRILSSFRFFDVPEPRLPSMRPRPGSGEAEPGDGTRPR